MLSYEENHVNKFVNDVGGLAAIDKAQVQLDLYAYGSYYESKEKRLYTWSPDKGELYELVIAVWTATLLNKSLTIQALTGMIAGRIGLEGPIASAQTAAEVIAVISKSGLITIDRRGAGKSIFVRTTWKINKEIPTINRHMPLTKRPEIITKNFDEDLGSMILGGAVKHHEGNICLDHLNRMNQIELTLNKPLLCEMEEAPSKKLWAKLNNPNNLNKRAMWEQWQDFLKNSYETYHKLIRGGNLFFLDHQEDTRGRTYVINYHVSTQGSSFKKAIVQLANKELVEM